MSARNEYLELITWINAPVRKPAIHAFAEGPARQVASAVEGLLKQYVTTDKLFKPKPLPPTEVCPRCGYKQYVKGRSPVPDCQQCTNRGRVNGLSEDTFCSGCKWQKIARFDYYERKPA